MTENKEKYLKAKELIAAGKTQIEALAEVGIKHNVWGYYKMMESKKKKPKKIETIEFDDLVSNDNLSVTLTGSPRAIRSFFESGRA